MVAADGIHSAARGVLFPGHPGPVHAGFTTRRVGSRCPAPSSPRTRPGAGAVSGARTPARTAGCTHSTRPRPPAGEHPPDDERAELARRFGDRHDPIRAVIAAARPEDVLRHDVHRPADPLPAFHRGRVALLGDPAHAMPPTL
nr:hypothetical protein [Streptomyces sp. NEAU-HV9]